MALLLTEPFSACGGGHDGGSQRGAQPTSSEEVDPSGKFVYVTNSASNDVSMYSIGTSGTLTLIASTGS